MTRTVLAALLMAAAPAVLAAAPPTLDQSIGLMSVRNPRLSPDGRSVVYERQETDWKENAYVTQLFLADAASGTVGPAHARDEGGQQRGVVPGRPLDRVPDRARGRGAAREAAPGKEAKDARTPRSAGEQARRAPDLDHLARRAARPGP